MKIMQINSYSDGSTGHIAQAVHNALLNSGNDSLLAYGAGSDVLSGGYGISNKADMFTHTAVTLLTGLHGYSSSIATYKLIKKIKEFNPDIVHLHNLHGGYVNITMLLNYLIESKLKIVITLHDCWLYTGKCYHYYEAQCNKFMQSCGNCPQLSMYPKSYFFDFTKKMLADKKRILSDADNLYLVTVSDWLKTEVKKTFLGKYPIKTIPNGVNKDFILKTDCGVTKVRNMADGKFIILGVASSWNKHKGINDFIKLSKLLKDDEIIILVGNIANNSTITDNIILVDRTSNTQELASFYNAASVYVSMSTEETFGLTIAEALSCGTPAIVYNATACAEMVSDGENGYVVTPHDINQVYKCIQKIREEKDIDKNSIAQNAREKYSISKMINEYLSFYRGVIDDNIK